MHVSQAPVDRAVDDGAETVAAPQVSPLAAPMIVARPIALVIHRYVGLFLTLFLVVAGLTGSLLAFYPELDQAINSAQLRATSPTPDATFLDAYELQRRLQAQLGAALPLHSLSFEREAG